MDSGGFRYLFVVKQVKDIKYRIKLGSKVETLQLYPAIIPIAARLPIYQPAIAKLEHMSKRVAMTFQRIRK